VHWIKTKLTDVFGTKHGADEAKNHANQRRRLEDVSKMTRSTLFGPPGSWMCILLYSIGIRKYNVILI